EADAGIVVHNDRLLIDVGDADAAADIHHSAVVEEAAVAPFPAFESDAAVPKPVVDAAIEPDVGSPVAFIESVCAVCPAPISRGPEHADGRWLNPGAGH